MEINEAIIDKLSGLSGLRFEETDKKNLIADLGNMIAFVEKLNEVNTDDIEALLHMSGNTNMLREDIVTGSLTREQALSNAPLKDKTFFKVLKVINK